MSSIRWNVMPRGCAGHLCFNCAMKIFDGRKDKDATCFHCKRQVTSFSYALSATHQNASSLQDRLSSLDALVSDLKKNLASVGAEADGAISRLNEWRLWGLVAKDKVSTMPHSDFPRSHVVARSEPGSRSRSPPRRAQVQLARLEYAPPRVPEYDG